MGKWRLDIFLSRSSMPSVCSPKPWDWEGEGWHLRMPIILNGNNSRTAQFRNEEALWPDSTHTNIPLTKTHSDPLFILNDVLFPSHVYFKRCLFCHGGWHCFWVSIWFHQHLAIYQEIHEETWYRPTMPPCGHIYNFFVCCSGERPTEERKYCGWITQFCSQTVSFRGVRGIWSYIQYWPW